MAAGVLTFPAGVASYQDVTTLITDLKTYHQWFVRNTIKEGLKSGKGTPPPVLSDAALEMIRAISSTRLVTAHDVEVLVRIIERSRDSAPTLTVTLAAPVPGSLKKTLVEWIRANIAPNALVSFHFNAGILGGMVVRTGSHIFDWSLRRGLMDHKDGFVRHLNVR